MILNKNKKIKESLVNMPNIVLIGDSMLNNSNYIEHDSNKDLSIPGLIKDSGTVNLYNYAKDGATIKDCYTQITGITQMPKNTTVFISAGGNDIVNESNKNVVTKDTITILFKQYSEMVLAIQKHFPGITIYLLTLYKPTNKQYSKLYKNIDQWNEKLTEFAKKKSFKLIQTNILLTTDEDFIYSIEPSKIGGKKIADAILSSAVINQ
jgi:lysophospholipase L1-like esterase